jgi:type III restriction enzyme
LKNDNPILNNPYKPPQQHYATDPKDGSLNYNDIRKGRRVFSREKQVIPMKQVQASLLDMNDASTKEDLSHIINLLRQEITDWRNKGYPDVTRVSQTLLNFWFNNPEREVTKKLFYAQQEAIETAIWLNEVAERTNPGNNILSQLKDSWTIIPDADKILPRLGFKMATGTGKTVVMAALILYHYFNRSEYRNDTRFADYFLIVAPGVTIKDRLGVLYVDTLTTRQDEIKDYYRVRGLVPRQMNDLLEGLNSKLVITNYHSFELRTLLGNKKSPFDGKFLKRDDKGKETKNTVTENPALMIKRMMSNFKTGGRLLVINDEAHHCYYPKPSTDKKNEKYKTVAAETTTDEKAEVKEENERAAVWYTGILELSKKFQLKAVYDLSATPYFLNGSGYIPYSLFPWVISDFGLIEAIESGLVKIPFLPEKDNTHSIDQATLSNIYEKVKSELPKKGLRTKRAEAAKAGESYKEEPPQLPSLVKNALDQFFSHYKKDYVRIGDLFSSPPVMIIVCNNVTVSKEVYKWVAGYEYENQAGQLITTHGAFDLFTNYDKATQQLLKRPPTLLIDSDALENSNQINEDYKKVFASEIDTFKREYRITHPGRSVENVTDADILREVVNTVGKPNALGSHIRCVVSVSMLTEGWDANTVTHIVGIRAFGSQLLCEQIAGRALRRKNYYLQGYDKEGIPTEDKRKIVIEKYPPEYAHIIGVPFKMFKGGESTGIITPKEYKTIEALPSRQAAFEITFPNVTGYRVELEEDAIVADFSKVENYELDGSKIPTRTIMFTAFSEEKGELNVEQVKAIREQSVIFAITKDLIELKFSDDGKNKRFDKFNQLKKIVTEWYNDKVYCKGDTFKQMLLYDDPQKVIAHIYRGIIASQKMTAKILPVLNYYNKFGSTKYVHGNTVKPVFETTKSHVNFVVADTESWEQIAAKTLEELDEVKAYVKNAFLGFTIPYSANRKEDNLYYPDFIARCLRPDGSMMNLIIEVTGMNREKAAKKDYVMNRWLPAINNIKDQYAFDEWDFIEIANDITDIKNQLKNKINAAIKGIKETKAERLERLKKSFGGIKSDVYLSPEDLSRENLYRDDE